MDKKAAHFSDITLERFVLGELPRAEVKAVEGALAGNEALKKRVKEIKVSNQSILSEYNPEEMMDAFERKLHFRNVQEEYHPEEFGDDNKGSFLAGLGLPTGVLKVVGGLAILALLLVPVSKTFWDRPTDAVGKAEEIRIKGHKPVLKIYKKTPGNVPGAGGGFEKLSGDNWAVEGDVIQMGYVAAGKKYGTIFSVDGRGAFTLHFPVSEKSSPVLKGDGENLLTEAYELDDAPFFEKFFFVTAKDKMDLIEVLSAGRAYARKLSAALKQGPEAALKELSGPVLPQKYHQESFLIKKGTP